MQSEKKHRKIFPKTLVLKAIGTVEQIETFAEDIRKLYSNITFSHIIRNRDNPGFHIFINIVLPSKEETQ